MTDEIDHRTLIAGLTAEERAFLLLRSDKVGVLHLMVHWGAIVFFGALIVLQVPYWPALIPVQGILIVFLFTTVHEAIHGTAFRSAWINEGVANACGFLILLPPQWFRYFHFAHHRHTHDPEHDPELAEAKPETVTQYLVYLSGISYWSGQLRTLAINAAGRNRDEFVPAKRRRGLAVEARRFIAAYSVVALLAVTAADPVILWAWLVPILVGQPFLRAYLLAEHTLCPHVVNMLQNSRTTFTNGLVRFIAWNMPYHAEHHAYPAVPFHKLPAFHKMTRKHLGTTIKGYARFQGELLATFWPGESR